jgi:hypothetical protein
MSDIQDDVENRAEEVKDGSEDQHLGDAMDEADPESGDDQRQNQGDRTEQDDSGNALDGVDLGPPSS